MSTLPTIWYPALPGSFTDLRPDGRRVDAIVMHATAGSKSGDLRALSGRDPDHLVSCHYYITKAGELFHLVKDGDIAWHAGVSRWQGENDVNRFSIGVELENRNNGSDPYPDVQIEVALALARHKVREFSIPRSRVMTHAQCALPPGRKTDPRGFPMAAFLDVVYAPEHDEATAYVCLFNGVPVRTAPNDDAPVAWDGKAMLYEGSVVDIAEVVDGELIMRPVYGRATHSNKWAHWPAAGFVWLPQLRQVDT